jgi:predicted ATP-dependent protease
VSQNWKHTLWLKPSVTELLRVAPIEEVDDVLAQAKVNYTDASAATKRRWETMVQRRKAAAK